MSDYRFGFLKLCSLIFNANHTLRCYDNFCKDPCNAGDAFNMLTKNFAIQVHIIL